MLENTCTFNRSGLMPEIRPPEWFQMPEVRRRRLASNVWIPLRQSETLQLIGERRVPGFLEETLLVGSLAVYAEHREIGATLSWGNIGMLRDPGPYMLTNGSYKPADQYHHLDTGPVVGIDLVIVNNFNRAHHREWIVNQDLVTALRLLREGDSWVSPNEAYMEVIRQRRDEDGRIFSIEIRAEHLRDYLCARGMALRLTQYRQRVQILSDVSHIPWHSAPVVEERQDERFRLTTFSVSADGGLLGRIAVMKTWRTDVDHEVDVPELEQEGESNTDYESYSFERTGPTLEQVEGELWRDEWVEPAARSERVRGDRPAEQLYYSTGAAGERKSERELNNEDVGLYLWFKAEVIDALLAYRGSGLRWHTAETGEVKCSPDDEVHFGINECCRINVYAYDIAKLPQWQQRIWNGFNISPDGPPCRELMDAQFRCRPADTEAPEEAFSFLIGQLNTLFQKRFGALLFKPHDNAEEIISHCHRFRALKENGILALAKDIARLTADSIDIGLLKALVALGPKENLGGLKLLERLLNEYTDRDEAHQIMGPLHIAYGLRLGDAHLPSKADIEKALADLKAPKDAPPLVLGTILIDRVCLSLNMIGRTIFVGPKASKNAEQE